MFRSKYLIQVNYKSGISMQFWVYDFTITNGDYAWKVVDQTSRPVLMNVDEVESVWQIRRKLWGFI